MKRSISILTPLVAILLAVALMPTNTFAQNPNFAGNWTLNADESNLGSGGGGGARGGRGGMGGGAAASMAVKHEGNTLTITTTRQGRDGQSTERIEEYIADGEAHSVEGGRMPTTYTATWNDGKLAIVSTITINMQGQTREMTTNYVYSMAGGKLVVESTRQGMGGGGSTTIKAVYDKKD
jgi:hypothetical protein